MTQIDTMMKDLKKVYDRVEQRMKANMRNKNYDEYDVKTKWKKYQDGLDKARERYRKVQDKSVQKQKAELMTNRSLNPGEINDYQRLNDHMDRVNNLHKEAVQTTDIYQGIVEETANQNATLDNMRNDAA